MAKRFFIQIIVVMVVAGIFSALYFYSICDNLRRAKEGVPGDAFVNALASKCGAAESSPEVRES